MFYLKESKINNLKYSDLETKYSFEVNEEPPIKFKGDTIEMSSHRTKISVVLKFVFLEDKIDFDFNDELI
jgi:hypothetical protein